ncbi:armadillo-type protein, partial [Catenaria anguillulae PL171]
MPPPTATTVPAPSVSVPANGRLLPQHAVANIQLPDSLRARLAHWLHTAGITSRKLAAKGLSPFASHHASAANSSSHAAPSALAGAGASQRSQTATAASMAAAADTPWDLPLNSSMGGGARQAANKPVRNVQFAPAPMTSGEGDDVTDSEADLTAVTLAAGGDPGAAAASDAALEAGLVHTIVHLLVSLVPAAEPSLRTHSLHLLVDLAHTMSPLSQDRLESLRAMIATQGPSPDPAPVLGALLDHIGASLAPIAVPVATGLSHFLTHRDSAVRAIAAVALARLLMQHTARFEEADRLAVVWDLVFALTASASAASVAFAGSASGGGGQHGGGGYASVAKKGGNEGGGGGGGHYQLSLADVTDRRDRRVMIEALGALAGMYQQNADLVAKVIEGLLRLDVKTESERTAIQSTLTRLSDTPHANLAVAVVEQIRPEDDDSLDLIWWLVQTLTPSAPLPSLLDAHLTSPQPAVRYGCALVLDAYCHLHPSRIPSLAPMLTLGFHDRCVPVALIYRSLFRSLLGTTPGALAATPGIPCPFDLMERVATAMEYMGSTADQLGALAFLDEWAPRASGTGSGSPPPLVLQSLVNCLHSPMPDVRMAALGVLAKLAPAMMSAALTTPPHAPIHDQIHLVWTHLCQVPSAMWAADLGVFPALAPALRAQKDFYLILFERMINGAPAARSSIYAVLKGVATTGAPSDKAQAVGLLALALGDMHPGAHAAAVEALAAHRPAMAQMLGQLRETHKGMGKTADGYARMVSVWDDAATAVADAGLLAEWVRREEVMDRIWDCYLGGQPEHAVAPSPDDYAYARALEVHSPIWLSLVLHRLSVAPPPITKNEKRGTVPQLVTLRRRHFAGYLLVMFPMLGYPDVAIRQAACTAVVAAVFSGVLINNLTAKALVEYVVNALANHKAWTYVCSALDIAALFLRTKVPNLSQFLFSHFLGIALDWAVNSPSVPVRVSSLEFLDVVCAIFPQASNVRLPEVRDAARQCLVDRDPMVATAAARVWSRVFGVVSETNVPEFVQYIRNEMVTVHARSPVHVQSDPLLQHLSLEERKRLVALHLDALGNVKHASQALPIVQLCLPMLASSSRMYRRFALVAILRQFASLREVDRHVAAWACLPLSADAALAVCRIVDAGSRGSTSSTSSMALAVLSAHPDDATAFSAMSLDEMLDGNAVLSVAQQNRVHNHRNTRVSLTQYPQLADPTADKQHQSSHSHAERLTAITSLVTKLAGWVPESAESQVLYHLERAAENPHLVGGALMTLAEFCCMHDSTLEHVTGLLLRHVVNRNKVAMDAMVRLSEHSPSAFNHVLRVLLSSLGSSVELEPGVIECLRHMVPLIREMSPDKIDNLLMTLIPSVTAARHSLESRLLVAELIADLLLDSPASAVESTPSTERIERATEFLDALYTLMSKDEATEQVYALLRRVTKTFCPPQYPHKIFSHLQTRTMALVLEGNELERLEAVDMASCAFLTEQDTATCVLLLLADETPAVVTKAVNILKPVPTDLTGYMSKCGPAAVQAVVQRIMDWLQQMGRRVSASSRDRVAHAFAVLSRLFRVAEQASAESMQSMLVQYLQLATASAARLRATQSSDISKSALALEEYVGIGLVSMMDGSVGQLNSSGGMGGIATSLTAAASAAAAASAGGAGTRVDAMEARKNILTGSLAERQAELDHWVHAQMQLLAILSCARSLDPAILLEQLKDDHRGVRSAAVRSLLHITLPTAVAQQILVDTLAAIESDAQHATRLYHRKLDQLRLAVGLECKLRSQSKQVLDVLIRAWRDPIRAVRAASIQLVRQLGVAGIPDSNRLMEAMGALVSRDDYPERASLNGLLTWFILQPSVSTSGSRLSMRSGSIGAS